ncbi:MAG: response regulator [Pirellulales bacterium]
MNEFGSHSGLGLLHGSCILIVDDDPGILDLYSAALLREGAIVMTAAGPEEAWETILASKDRLTAIIVDIVLQNANGMDLATRIRVSGLACPVIAISSLNWETVKGVCAKAGCSGFVHKRDWMSTLIKTVSDVIRLQRPDRAADPTSSDETE